MPTPPDRVSSLIKDERSTLNECLLTEKLTMMKMKTKTTETALIVTFDYYSNDDDEDGSDTRDSE